MRIAIQYRDGHYSMYDPSQRTFAVSVDPKTWTEANTITIPQSEWKRYQEHLEQCQVWQERIRQYDNRLHGEQS
jgi:Leu/Phe-tRNA-protein transferase